MVYRIAGGVAFLLFGFTQAGVVAIPALLIGVLFIVAGIALLAGQ